MRKLSEPCDTLSDRILLLSNTFRAALESGAGLPYQQAKTFAALLDESYEDALLLEGTVQVRTGRRSAEVLAFPSAPRCVVDNTGAEDGQ
ncbi:hypothetical protein [Pelagibacterium halotolerans]|uniref:Uncharacterized protein n=1 Tax=Pelagibacterium halotolerans (strain DSM 22347 / JCM 15775 / CGMCC 1.7692 / B2) TaxID=1082931 RepID=G4RDF4_PELHB|nr:hypothetical protein [Pelagibacterium halotolerans]AEQ50780.1 hypothetical protein KKY_741 [Pelagibacterium halotolerans B2]QJR19303.1 hypothetical protein HKM20_13155 [Pelagibacterium halotolerans]SDZ95666.1 hypothetical protein SAMN05428936_101667 [Pelagibacterium halotolerans]